MKTDRIITGGQVVTPGGMIEADIGITGETISLVGKSLSNLFPEAELIDARGCYVLPGVIDSHVHLDMPVKGTVTSDDYRSGTRAAARGGVTTVLDFATAYGDETLSEAVDNEHQRAEGKALVDYAFHVRPTQWEKQKCEIPGLIKRGLPTFKENMIYASEGWQSNDRVLYNTLETMRDLGGMLLVHAESSLLLDEMIARYHRSDLMRKYGAELIARSRPSFIETEAVQRVIKWCEVTGGSLYVVHVSTGEAAGMIEAAQKRGIRVRGETCPQYLVLNEEVFSRKDGFLFASSPQVKTKADSEALWKALQSGSLSVAATDHCTFTRKQKSVWKGDWTKIPGGLPGVETLLPILYTHGVLKNRLTLEQLCDRLCLMPAKLMGLYPRKGVIQVGADADLLIVHPRKRIQVDWKNMETNADWSPYQDWRLAGFPRAVLSRGETIVDQYKVVGREGRGRWLARRLTEVGG